MTAGRLRKSTVPSSNPAGARRAGNAAGPHRGERDRAAGEPRSAQHPQPVAAHEQAADAGGVSEHLVERGDNERRPHRTEIELVRRHERRCVEQHVPAPVLGVGDEAERVLNARVVGLRGIREEAWGDPASPPGEGAVEPVAVDAQIRWPDRHVLDARSGAAGDLADAVDRVVVVDREREDATGPEGVRIGDDLEAGRGVGREDAHVVVAGRAEERQDRSPRPLHLGRRRQRRRVGRVGIAEHARAQELGVGVDLRSGVQARSCVVEVRRPAGLQAPVLAAPELGVRAIGVELRRRHLLHRDLLLSRRLPILGGGRYPDVTRAPARLARRIRRETPGGRSGP